MCGGRKKPRAGILILYALVFLNPAPECLGERVTKRDLADVLPAADAFARKTEPFPYLLGYTTNGGYLIGAVFLTTEVVPDESWGYREQIATLVGVDSEGKITGIKVLSEFESPRYTKGLLGDGSWFLAQFEGKDAGDNFLLHSDVDAITGATITSSAVTRSVRAGLELITEQVLRRHVDKANPVRHLFFRALAWQIDFVFLWVIVGLAFRSFFHRSESSRYFVLGLSFAYLGIVMGGGASINDVLRFASGRAPVFLSNLYWYSLVVIAIALIPIAGRFYCGWLCPFGAMIEVVFRLVPIEWKISEEAERYLKVVKYVNLGILLMIGSLFANNTLAMYLAGMLEPFATLFNLHGDVVSWAWLILMVLFSAFVSRLYCRYFCPLGALFGLLSGLCSLLGVRLIRVRLPEDSCKGCRLAQEGCRMNAIRYDEGLRRPEIDGSECVMCNRCAGVCPVRAKELW